MIDRIKRVALRQVWKHEAHDFTVFMEENIDVPSEISRHFTNKEKMREIVLEYSKDDVVISKTN